MGRGARRENNLWGAAKQIGGSWVLSLLRVGCQTFAWKIWELRERLSGTIKDGTAE
jgi:hypothetical protein